MLRVTRSTIYRMVHRGDLPGAFRIGSDFRFSRRAIENWIAAQIKEGYRSTPPKK